MKNLFFTAFLSLFFLCSMPVFGQTTSPTPPDDDTDTLKISTTLIQADVTVTDKKGNVVTDLKPEEFEVYENGKKQTITNFSFVSVTKPTETRNPRPSKPDRNALAIPSAKLKAEQVRRTYALVVDDLGLSFENVSKVRQSLRKFVNEQMQPGDLVAILRTGSGIGTLQSFTFDKNQLLAAIEKVRWNSQGRSGISAIAPVKQGTVKDSLIGQIDMNGNSRAAEGIDADRDFEKQVEGFRQENFAIGTLGGLSYIIRGMVQLPGRKSLLLFSEGFTLTSGGSKGESGLVRQNQVFEALRRLADLANRSSVVVYTLDPRGLQVPGMLQAADQTWDDSVGAQIGQRGDAFLETQQTLRFLAYQTGGLPFINQNDLNKGIDDVIEDQSSYYLLGYEPDDETFDPKKARFNKLEIKVTRPGVKVRYRSGFFGITDEKIRNAAPTPQQKLYNALTSPFGENDVNLSVYPVFQNDPKNGDLIQALVYIDAKDLRFTRTGDGKVKAVFDIVAMTFGDNGIPVERLSKIYTLEVPDKVYQNMLGNGFVYTLSVPVKKSGAYQFRIALRDTVSDRVGSASQFVEVPNIRKRMVLSSLLLDNFTAGEWEGIKRGRSRDESERSVLLDTTLRQYKRGTILRYDYIIYNPGQSRQIESQMRLIKDGKVIYEEQPSAVKTDAQTDLQRLQTGGALTLGTNLEAGSYVLQIIATDKTKAKKFATQFVEFEIVE
jgi:VWFA-related protein